MAIERTLVLIKPDGVMKRLVGEILHRFERKGLRLAAVRMLNVSMETAERHYSVHKGKPFYDGLIDYITSGPVVAMVLEGDGAISVVRKMIGSTDGSKAEPGTIRGDFSMSVNFNTVHASDSVESANYEIPIFFGEKEILEYRTPDKDFI
ncbi:MAG: nucleoside-diphosphate kinase [Candidatus Marsarchaeota archaeon]|nr:nucleoside-diphosphate kinase [Candidatus Marsarchaeota archaeon]